MGNNILDGLGVGNYFDVEGVPTQQSKAQVEKFKADTINIDAGSKLQIKLLLSQVESYITSNRSAVQKQVDLLGTSESIIKKQLKDFSDDNTVKDLKKQAVSSEILNIAYTSYSDYYSNMQELKYRLAIITYKRDTLKTELKEYDDKIKIIQDYSSAIS